VIEMVSRAEIIENIEQIVTGDYTRWTIGLTEDPERRKEEHKNPRNVVSVASRFPAKRKVY